MFKKYTSRLYPLISPADSRQLGGGIMLGDGGGSNIVAKNNILVDPGQYGMAVSGGSYMPFAAYSRQLMM